MAALLSSVLDKTDDVVKYIGECRDLYRWVPKWVEGAEVLPPDVNESGWKFTVTAAGKIRFGLGAVRGVGAGAVQSVLKARDEEGAFSSLFDFLERIDIRALNKRACEALISAGALDAFGHRAQLIAGLERAYGEVQSRQADKEAGQGSLFGGEDGGGLDATEPPLPEVPDWAEPDRLAREKEALGFFISGHPLDRIRDLVQAYDRTANSQNLGDFPNQPVEIACVVTQVSRQISKRDNSEWGKITVEDFHGTATILAFKDAWEGARELLQQDALVLIRGKVSGRERDEEDPPVFLDGAEPLEALPQSGRLAVQIEMAFQHEIPEDAFDQARRIINSHPGGAPVMLQIGRDNGVSAPRFRSRSLRVATDPETLSELKELFGKAHVRLVKLS